VITVIGCAPGGPAPVLPEDVPLVVGAARHLDAVTLPPGARRIVLGPPAPALDAIAEERRARPERRCVVLASGDPGFFGIVRLLAERFGPAALDVRPAPSSVAVAFARLGLPWEDAVVASAHGRAPTAAVNVIRAHRKVAVLTAPGAGPAELAAALLATPGIVREFVVASDLGGPGEQVVRCTPEEAAARDWPAVSLLLSLHPSALAAPGPMRALAGGARRSPAPGSDWGSGWALPEDAFAHRDSMVTKAEVRALALARLGPRTGELVWDVGAGSGSVAVECARLGAAALAVERAADGVARIRANAAAHDVDVAVLHGAAPAVLHSLPASADPDAVFVGGGGAELPSIVRACAARARRAVVVTLAALDRVPGVRAELAAAGFAVDGVLLQSARLAPLPGEVTRLAAVNPVFVLWGTRPEPTRSAPTSSSARTAADPGGTRGVAL